MDGFFMKFFRLSLYCTDIEIIKFWAPNSPSKGPQGAKFPVDDSATSDIVVEPYPEQLHIRHGGRLFCGQTHPVFKGQGPQHPIFSVMSSYAPVTVPRALP